MSEVKRGRTKLPPEVLKRSERLKKSRKRKENLSTDSEAKSKAAALDVPECGTSKETKSTAEMSDEKQANCTEESGKPEGALGAKSNSPEPNCAICLSKLENKSFTDSCFHMFCFVCLMEWSKIKAECPLCKQVFKSIIHNVRSYEDYDQYHLERPENQPTWENPGGRRFRYRTTVTEEHIFSFHRFADILRRPTAVGAIQRATPVTTRQNWRRQRQIATSEFRSRIYTNGMRVKEIVDANGRHRDISPAFFSSNPAATHRLIPWLNRELNALLFNRDQHVQFLIELITGLIKRFGIQSEEFYQHVYPFVGRHTRHFMEEFQMFARSPFSMTIYDTKVIYEQEPQSVSDTDSDLSFAGNDSDIMIISPSASTGTVGAMSVVPSLSIGRRRRQNVEPRAERSWFEIEVSPRTVSLRDLLEDNSFSTPVRSGTGQSGWESPTPGTSWDISLTGSVANQIDVSTTEGDESHASKKAKKQRRSKQSNDVKLEDKKEQSRVIDSGSASDCSSSSEVIFLGFDRPWQERSPVLISSAEESEKEEDSKDIQNKKELSKTSLKEKSATRSRRDLYSSDERHSSRSSSFSRYMNSYLSGHHKRKRSRSSSYTKKKESRSHSHGGYKHKKFSRSQRYKRHRSRSLSTDDLHDPRHIRRSDSTTSKNSQRTNRKRSLHDGDLPANKRKRSDGGTNEHVYHASRSASRDLMIPVRNEKHQKHKKHRKHKRDSSRSRHEKKRSHKKRRNRSRDDENGPALASSNSNKDKHHERETLKSYVLPINRASKPEIPSHEMEYSDVSEDSISFSSKSSLFKKHTSGHKKSRKHELNNLSAGESPSTSSRSFKLINYHPVSTQSDTDSLPGDSLSEERCAKLISANESITCESTEKECDKSAEDKNRDVSRTDSVSSIDSGVAVEVHSDRMSDASLLTMVSRKNPDQVASNDRENVMSTNDSRETNNSDVTDKNSSEEPITVSSSTKVHSSMEIPGSSLDYVSDCGLDFLELLNDGRLNLEQPHQMSNTVSLAPETLTIDSSSNDSIGCGVSSSGVYTDGQTVGTNVSVASSNSNFSYLNIFGQKLHGSVLDSISSILPGINESSVLPGSASDMPCNIESEDEIEIQIESDSDMEMLGVDVSRRKSRNVGSKSGNSDHVIICSDVSDTESEKENTGQKNENENPLHNDHDYSDHSETKKSDKIPNLQPGSTCVIPKIDHFAVFNAARNPKDKHESLLEEKPLDLSADCEKTHPDLPIENGVLDTLMNYEQYVLSKPLWGNQTDNASSTKTESTESNKPMIENTLEEKYTSSKKCTTDEALDLRAKSCSSHSALQRSDCSLLVYSDSNLLSNALCQDGISRDADMSNSESSEIVGQDSKKECSNPQNKTGKFKDNSYLMISNRLKQSEPVKVSNDSGSTSTSGSNTPTASFSGSSLMTTSNRDTEALQVSSYDSLNTESAFAQTTSPSSTIVGNVSEFSVMPIPNRLNESEKIQVSSTDSFKTGCTSAIVTSRESTPTDSLYIGCSSSMVTLNESTSVDSFKTGCSSTMTPRECTSANSLTSRESTSADSFKTGCTSAMVTSRECTPTDSLYVGCSSTMVTLSESSLVDSLNTGCSSTMVTLSESNSVDLLNTGCSSTMVTLSESSSVDSLITGCSSTMVTLSESELVDSVNTGCTSAMVTLSENCSVDLLKTSNMTWRESTSADSLTSGYTSMMMTLRESTPADSYKTGCTSGMVTARESTPANTFKTGCTSGMVTARESTPANTFKTGCTSGMVTSRESTPANTFKTGCTSGMVTARESTPANTFKTGCTSGMVTSRESTPANTFKTGCTSGMVTSRENTPTDSLYIGCPSTMVTLSESSSVDSHTTGYSSTMTPRVYTPPTNENILELLSSFDAGCQSVSTSFLFSSSSQHPTVKHDSEVSEQTSCVEQKCKDNHCDSSAKIQEVNVPQRDTDSDKNNCDPERCQQSIPSSSVFESNENDRNIDTWKRMFYQKIADSDSENNSDSDNEHDNPSEKSPDGNLVHCKNDVDACSSSSCHSSTDCEMKDSDFEFYDDNTEDYFRNTNSPCSPCSNEPNSSIVNDDCSSRNYN